MQNTWNKLKQEDNLEEIWISMNPRLPISSVKNRFASKILYRESQNIAIRTHY